MVPFKILPRGLGIRFFFLIENFYLFENDVNFSTSTFHANLLGIRFFLSWCRNLALFLLTLWPLPLLEFLNQENSWTELFIVNSSSRMTDGLEFLNEFPFFFFFCLFIPYILCGKNMNEQKFCVHKRESIRHPCLSCPKHEAASIWEYFQIFTFFPNILWRYFFFSRFYSLII